MTRIAIDHDADGAFVRIGWAAIDRLVIEAMAASLAMRELVVLVEEGRRRRHALERGESGANLATLCRVVQNRGKRGCAVS